MFWFWMALSFMGGVFAGILLIALVAASKEDQEGSNHDRRD